MSEAAELAESARNWVLAALPGTARLRCLRRLRGGLSAHTHLLELDGVDAALRQLVLKRLLYPRPGEVAQVVVEVAALTALSGAALPFEVAQVVAHDALANACDMPALLMTRAQGAIALELADWPTRVAELGRALAAFHAAHVPCPLGVPPLDIGLERRHKPVPPGIETPEWARIFELVATRSWDGQALLHGDYHIGNALFERSKLTGVVDWANARRGPLMFDVAYCRLDLSMVIGPEAPPLFLGAYEQALGRPLRDVAAWDVAASLQAYPDPAMWLPGWLDAGRADLTPELVRSRLSDFLARAFSAL